jgi:hypothetical protein
LVPQTDVMQATSTDPPDIVQLVSQAVSASAEARVHSDWATLFLTSKGVAAGGHFGSIEFQLSNGPLLQAWAEVNAGVLRIKRAQDSSRFLRSVNLRHATVVAAPRYGLEVRLDNPDMHGDTSYTIRTADECSQRYWAACLSVGASNCMQIGTAASRGWWQKGGIDSRRVSRPRAERQEQSEVDVRHQLKFALQLQRDALDAVSAAVEQGAILDDVSRGTTPLLVASRDGEAAIVRLLLDSNATVDTMGPDGATPLMVAAVGGHESVVGALLRAGAELGQATPSGPQEAAQRARTAAQRSHGAAFGQLLTERQGIVIDQLETIAALEAARVALQQAQQTERQAEEAANVAPAEGRNAAEVNALQDAISTAEAAVAKTAKEAEKREKAAAEAQTTADAEDEAKETAGAFGKVETALKELKDAQLAAAKSPPQFQKERDEKVIEMQVSSAPTAKCLHVCARLYDFNSVYCESWSSWRCSVQRWRLHALLKNLGLHSVVRHSSLRTERSATPLVWQSVRSKHSKLCMSCTARRRAIHWPLDWWKRMSLSDQTRHRDRLRRVCWA